MHVSISRREAALEEWLLLFLFFSAAGWIWEVLLTACATGMWVNRGMLHGPWLPVYGVGGVLITAALGRLRRQWLVLPLGALAGGAVEYGTSLALEFRFRQRWWDYTGQPGNILGQVCPLFGLLWFLIMPLAIWAEDTARWFIWFYEGMVHKKKQDAPAPAMYSLGSVYLDFIKGK